MNDAVNHPTHYNKPGHKECIDEMLDKYGNYNTRIFCLMNAYKYCYRAGLKGDNAEQDIQKAKWYLEYHGKLFENCEYSTPTEITRKNEIFDMIEEYRSKNSEKNFTVDELKEKIKEQSKLIRWIEERYNALSKENEYIMKKYTESVKNDG
jgi:hypothetical protein